LLGERYKSLRHVQQPFSDLLVGHASRQLPVMVGSLQKVGAIHGLSNAGHARREALPPQ
jgi:hypothetical protein